MTRRLRSDAFELSAVLLEDLSQEVAETFRQRVPKTFVFRVYRLRLDCLRHVYIASRRRVLI